MVLPSLQILGKLTFRKRRPILSHNEKKSNSLEIEVNFSISYEVIEHKLINAY